MEERMVFTCHATASLAVAAFFYRKHRQDGKIMACVFAGGACLGGVLIPDSPVAFEILCLHILGGSADSWSVDLESQAYNVVSSFFLWSFLVWYVRNRKNRPGSVLRGTEFFRQANVFALSGLGHVILDSISHGNSNYMRKLGRQYFWPASFDFGSWLTGITNDLTNRYQYVPLSMESLAILLPGDIFGWLFTVFTLAFAIGIVIWPKVVVRKAL